MRAQILIAEDDPGASRLLNRYLASKGYEVHTAADGNEALTQFFMHDPDVVLLDLNMPHMDGWQTLQEIRSLSDVPVILVTVQDSTAEKVRGLTEGADDYVTKPFDLKEIEARVGAVLRRSQRSVDANRVRVGPLSIDDETKEVQVNGERVHLTPKEYELLSLLASRPGRVFSSDEILQHVWADRSSGESTEDVKKYIYYLRGKLDRYLGGASSIETVRGFGYKLAWSGVAD